MAENSGIAWTDNTFNPWIGCQAVSAACDHCYAETLVKRWGGDFATRRRTKDGNWQQPRRWNKKAVADGKRLRVFCASLADVFDNKVPDEWRADLWTLIRETPALDWLLLTKRPQNIGKMLPDDWGDGYPNVWLGTTAENQTEHDRRTPHLKTIPSRIRFLSVEPMLGPIHADLDGIHWVITGGESAHHAREMMPEWDADLERQCKDAGVAFFRKQIGSNRTHWPAGITGKGDDTSQWPEHLRVQEWPSTDVPQ